MILTKPCAVAVMIVGISCAGNQAAVRHTETINTNQDSVKHVREKADVELDESFDPHSLGEDAWVIRSRTNASNQKSFTGYAFDNERNKLIGEAKEYSVMGYRIQLFVSTDYYEALTARDSAAARFPEEIYFDYEQPYYKIRAGNFTERQKADDARSRARILGYSDAWVVQTKVIIKGN